jgi:hypothetical protein
VLAAQQTARLQQLLLLLSGSQNLWKAHTKQHDQNHQFPVEAVHQHWHIMSATTLKLSSNAGDTQQHTTAAAATRNTAHLHACRGNLPLWQGLLLLGPTWICCSTCNAREERQLPVTQHLQPTALLKLHT